MHLLEQNMQNLLLQKQAFQMELAETDSALEELKNSGEEVFKIIGQLMIKSEKPKLVEELENKKRILELRLKSFEKQEKIFDDKIENLREGLIDSKSK